MIPMSLISSHTDKRAMKSREWIPRYIVTNPRSRGKTDNSRARKQSISKKVITHPSSLIILFLLMLCCTGAAQEIFWERVFDSGNTEYAGGIAVDSKGNFVVTGTTMPGAEDPGDHGDILTIKYNQDGETLWIRCFDTSQYDYAYAAAVDKNDNIIIAGRNRTDTATISDVWIIKYDSSGNILWTQSFGRKGEENGSCAVVVDSHDNIIVTGLGHQSNESFADYLTIKLDSAGDVLWTKWYDAGWEDIARDVTVDDSDNVIVTGYSNGIVNWDWCTVKYNASGDMQWVRRFDASIDDWAHGVAADREGNIIVAGDVRINMRTRGAVLKYNSQGDTLWSKVFTTNDPLTIVTTFTDIAIDENDNICLAGTFQRTDTAGRFWNDYYIAKCTSLCDTIWTTLCDHGMNDELTGITIDDTGNLAVTGTTQPTPESTIFDYYSVKIKAKTDGVYINLPNLPSQLALHPGYPNPFNTSTTIQYELSYSSNVELKVYDMIGKCVATLVNENKQPGIYNVVWHANDLATGLYVVKISTGKNALSQKLLLIK
jgi:hypothetical protein